MIGVSLKSDSKEEYVAVMRTRYVTFVTSGNRQENKYPTNTILLGLAL